MQNAKDTFYIALRNRLALLNPARVVSLRGNERPAILVEEAESYTANLYENVYVLRWTDLATLTIPFLIGVVCEIHYCTNGSQDYAGLDRGRSMAELDYDLISILKPECTPKMDFTTTPTTTKSTRIFWTKPSFGSLETMRNQLKRIARVTVFSFED